MAEPTYQRYFYREIKFSELEKSVLKELSWGQELSYADDGDPLDTVHSRLLRLKKREGSLWHFNTDTIGNLIDLGLIQISRYGIHLTQDGLRQASSLPYVYLSYTQVELAVLRTLVTLSQPEIRELLVELTRVEQDGRRFPIQLYELDEALRVLMVTGYAMTVVDYAHPVNIDAYRYCMNVNKIDEIREVLSGFADPFGADPFDAESYIDLSTEFTQGE